MQICSSVRAEFELVFIDFQGFNPASKRGRRNSKLGRSPGRSRDPASSFGQRLLDDFPLGSAARPCAWEFPMFQSQTEATRRFFGEPQFFN